MNCETAQDHLLDSRRSAELEAHLAACAACREFARARQVFARPIAPPPLPLVIHERVLQSSRGFMREHARGLPHAPLPNAERQTRGFALATIIVLYCVMLTMLLQRLPLEAAGYWFAGIIVAQNFLTLLFSPLMFARFRYRKASAH